MIWTVFNFNILFVRIRPSLTAKFVQSGSQKLFAKKFFLVKTQSVEIICIRRLPNRFCGCINEFNNELLQVAESFLENQPDAFSFIFVAAPLPIPP